MLMDKIFKSQTIIRVFRILRCEIHALYELYLSCLLAGVNITARTWRTVTTIMEMVAEVAK